MSFVGNVGRRGAPLIEPVLVATVLVGVASLLAPSVVAADVKPLQPADALANVDTKLAKQTLEVFAKGTEQEKQAAIEKIKAEPGNYAPPVLYALSNVLFDRGEKDDAAFWFYAGQLRGRIDANLSTDPSAGQAVGVLNQRYGTPINQYMFKRLPELKELVPRVVKWDEETPTNYDRRWVNLHGMAAVLSGLGVPTEGNAAETHSHPKDERDEIAKKTRADYLKGFDEAMEMAARMK